MTRKPRDMVIKSTHPQQTQERERKRRKEGRKLRRLES
jgi:hypothetical protein